MSKEMNIGEAIKRLEILNNEMKRINGLNHINNTREIKAIETVLADRERLIEKSKKYEELEKELKQVKNTTLIMSPLYVKQNYISKDKIKEILNSKYRVFFEGDAEFPDIATEIHGIKYIKASYLEELLKES